MLERGAYYAEGVGELEPRVASTLGLIKSNDVTPKALANVALNKPNSFRV
jgi:hypothetical protein